MKEYRLSSGLSFTMPPLPMDGRSDRFLALIVADAEAQKGLPWKRDMISALAEFAEPLKGAQLRDILTLDLDALIEDAVGGPIGEPLPKEDGPGKNSPPPDGNAAGSPPGWPPPAAQET